MPSKWLEEVRQLEVNGTALYIANGTLELSSLQRSHWQPIMAYDGDCVTENASVVKETSIMISTSSQALKAVYVDFSSADVNGMRMACHFMFAETLSPYPLI